MSISATGEVRVVIVEDYKLTRIGLRSTLNEFENVTVIGEAEDAVSGLEIIQREKPDVVLMDLGLPGMNGLEATMKVKEVSPDTNVVIPRERRRSRCRFGCRRLLLLCKRY